MTQLNWSVSTMDKSHILTPMGSVPFTGAAGMPDDNTIVVDPSVLGQPILGFGGNWTDTDVYNLLRMSVQEQDRVLAALFDPREGAGWSFMRVPFGSTDWERNFDFYSYDDRPEGEKDWELAHFSVQRDIDRGFFDLLRRVKAAYPHVELLASVWALPGWMKNNDSLIGGIFLPEYTEVYARYLRMAVQAFAQQGISLYAITIQNEPKSSDFPNNNRGTPCTRFTWRLQKDVLIALRREFKAHGIDTLIWAYDHNFDMVETFVDPLLADDAARAVIDGVAFHPYRGDPAVMGKYEEQYPDLPLYSTEKTIYDARGMDEMLRQLRYGARCYILWSFFEDSYGGPHQLIGTAFQYTGPKAPDQVTMIHNHPLNADGWSVSGAYGMFAQFSRYLKRGMRRIGCSYGHARWVTATAFAEEGGQVAVVAVNQTNAAQIFVLRCGGKAVQCRIPAQAVATYEFSPDAVMADASVRVEDAPQKRFYEPQCFDLAVEDLWFEEAPKAGTELRFRAKVKNVGDGATLPNTTLTVEILLDGDLRIGRVYATVPVMQPGDELSFAVNAPVYDVSGTGCKSTWTATAGWHDFMALMNVGNCYQREENIYNNRCCKEFFIEG